MTNGFPLVSKEEITTITPTKTQKQTNVPSSVPIQQTQGEITKSTGEQLVDEIIEDCKAIAERTCVCDCAAMQIRGIATLEAIEKTKNLYVKNIRDTGIERDMLTVLGMRCVYG